jgi:sugar lactone lactonase YvrE
MEMEMDMDMVTAEVVLANAEICTLGEGPVWDAARNRLLWVDIRRGTVFAGALQEDGRVEILERIEFDETVGAVAVAAAGELLIAGAEEILVRDNDGNVTRGPRVLPQDCGRRLNDGKPDPAGNFIVGSLSLGLPSSTEVLIHVSAAGEVTELDNDLTLSNGLAWTADGSRMYSIDTLKQVVYARSYDAMSGTTGPRSEFLQVNGLPDGMCLDAEEHLWIAMWGLGEVHRYSPAGKLVSVIKVPAPHVTSVAFAGPSLQTLVITTATQDLSEAQLAQYPQSGALFTLNTPVPGLPQPYWRGPVL